MPRPPRTASTPSTSSFSAKNATRSAATAASPSKSAGTIAPTACSKCPARACARRKTGAHIFKPKASAARYRRGRTFSPYTYRCARNCFLCPNCRNTLSVVPSDPADADDGRSLGANAVGEPPFFLYCSFCRWDSAEVDITFEKPTGLAGAFFFARSPFALVSVFT